MGLFEWEKKRFAHGIAKAMIRSYKLYKKSDPTLTELELVRKTLSDRSGEPAKTLLSDMEDESFWKSVCGGSLMEVIYLLVRLEYVEYMKGTLESENQKTNIIFRDTILEEIGK